MHFSTISFAVVAACLSAMTTGSIADAKPAAPVIAASDCVDQLSQKAPPFTRFPAEDMFAWTGADGWKKVTNEHCTNAGRLTNPKDPRKQPAVLFNCCLGTKCVNLPKTRVNSLDINGYKCEVYLA
ncbi:hypothetical protein BDF19DRAFT_453986 [Syncephalis fuscata]|nr:hypothetical protein BDF19DRAFT_453986 [Syncephalis fuscata]